MVANGYESDAAAAAAAWRISREVRRAAWFLWIMPLDPAFASRFCANVTAVEASSLPAAISVFLNRMMPEHIGHTRASYPMLDTLTPARRTALISLVFNRGGDLDGDRRREMKRIRELLQTGDLDAVAGQFEAMEGLWDPVKERGVIERRRREATLWRAGFSALLLD